MRCAVDGCRPVCSLISFSDTGSWCEASRSSRAKVRSSTWIVDGALLALLHAGSLHGGHFASRESTRVRRATSRRARRRCAPRLRASPGTGRRRSRRRRTGPGRHPCGGRTQAGRAGEGGALLDDRAHELERRAQVARPAPRRACASVACVGGVDAALDPGAAPLITKASRPGVAAEPAAVEHELRRPRRVVGCAAPASARGKRCSRRCARRR